MANLERKYCVPLFEIWYMISIMIYSFMLFTLMIFSAHGVNRHEHPKAFLFPPTEWNRLVTTFILPPFFSATLLLLFALIQRVFLPKSKRVPFWWLKGTPSSWRYLNEENKEISLRSIALSSMIGIFAWFLFMFQLPPGETIEWYPWDPLKYNDGLTTTTIEHSEKFSIVVRDDWPSHLVVTEDPPSLRIEVTCFGFPTGTSFFTVTMLDQKPDVSLMKEATFQDEPAWEFTNPRGGRRAICLEYSLVFEREGKWFRIDYWFPNSRGEGLYHNELPSNMREFIETFSYEPNG